MERGCVGGRWPPGEVFSEVHCPRWVACTGLRAGRAGLISRVAEEADIPLCLWLLQASVQSSRSSVPGAEQQSVLSWARSALVASIVTGVSMSPGEAVTARFLGPRWPWGLAAVWVRSAEHILGCWSRGWRRIALKGTSWELMPPQAPGRKVRSLLPGCVVASSRGTPVAKRP